MAPLRQPCGRLGDTTWTTDIGAGSVVDADVEAEFASLSPVQLFLQWAGGVRRIGSECWRRCVRHDRVGILRALKKVKCSSWRGELAGYHLFICTSGA